jgi:N-acetylglucosaminyltransferase
MPVPVNGLTFVLPLYVGLALTYSRAQRHFGRRWRSRPAAAVEPHQPDVDVIVPCYNEDPALLATCLEAIAEQRYEGALNVWVVDDGSFDRPALLPVLRKGEARGWTIELLDSNRGKRAAQDAVLWQAKGEILLTIDSDTRIDPDAVRRIVAPFRNPKVGAVASHLSASNAADTWLTGMLDSRYRRLHSERERAAQSWFGGVLCCAGPFAAYRRAVVDKVWSRYVRPSDPDRPRLQPPGDDLALTNLVLAEGFDSVYEPTAKAATHVPATLLPFLRQQRRWARSFYRALPQMLRLAVDRRCPYLALDLAARALLPAFLASAIVTTAVDAVFWPERLSWDAAALGAMGLAAMDLGPVSPWRGRRRFMVLYGLVFVVFLLPNRVAALCTLFRNHWETRRSPALSG